MDILMPKVGLTMTEGTIAEWRKREGEWVRRGEVLFTFETEKSSLEFESPFEGVLTRILAPAGQVIACLTPVAIVGEREQGREGAEEQGGAEKEEKEEIRGQKPEASRSEGERRAVSPRAKLRAREMGVPMDAVTGSGPAGVVLERDVIDQALHQRTHSGSVQASPISNLESPISSSPLLPRSSAPPFPLITPVAARMAAELGVDVSALSGSGPDGRITREDVIRYYEASLTAHATDVTRATPSPISHLQSPNPQSRISNLKSLTPARRITAQRTAESARTAPHVTLTTEADATALVSAREQLNAELNEKAEKVSYNALLVCIAARALKEHPQLNASWSEDGKGVIWHEGIHIGVAVDTPRGLYVPVVRDATRPLIEVHRALTDVVARTLAGEVTSDDFGGGTFTLTNLGMYEIDAFTPIINSPEAAILGVGRIQGKPVARGEQVLVRQMMALSLSFDHRVVDGAPAAHFLQRVKALIERPFALLM
jgi:pyruvate dehydrogenase E2 component (dihydrolipoamide acetyltransferase)